MLDPGAKMRYGRLVAPRSTLAFLFALAVTSGVTGCDRAPSASGLPEWTPKDHERGEESARAAQGQSPATGKPKKASPEALQD